MTINSILFSIQYSAPALLNIGAGAAGKTQNYGNLASLMGLNQQETQGDALNQLTNQQSDTVSLALDKIGSKIMEDLAGITAKKIANQSDLAEDYMVAIIDNGQSREARVYRRSEILATFEGTEEEKAALAAKMKKNPLTVYSSAKDMPATSSDEACQDLAQQLTDFLKTNKKTLDTLANAGQDPLDGFRIS